MRFSPQLRAIFAHQNFKKCSEAAVFCTFWLQNVLLATGACKFSTSKLHKVHAPTMRCFVHFDFKMCFSPQGRAIFRHRNFIKCSDHEVFCTFWLQNVLLAAAACNFWCFCWAPTSAPAALTGLPLDWPDPRELNKHSISRFYNIWRGCIASVSSFCWLDYSTLLFNCPYCRKLDF